LVLISKEAEEEAILIAFKVSRSLIKPSSHRRGVSRFRGGRLASLRLVQLHRIHYGFSFSCSASNQLGQSLFFSSALVESRFLQRRLTDRLLLKDLVLGGPHGLRRNERLGRVRVIDKKVLRGLRSGFELEEKAVVKARAEEEQVAPKARHHARRHALT
jgi:hypothetical protein